MNGDVHFIFSDIVSVLISFCVVSPRGRKAWLHDAAQACFLAGALAVIRQVSSVGTGPSTTSSYFKSLGTRSLRFSVMPGERQCVFNVGVAVTFLLEDPVEVDTEERVILVPVLILAILDSKFVVTRVELHEIASAEIGLTLFQA